MNKNKKGFVHEILHFLNNLSENNCSNLPNKKQIYIFEESILKSINSDNCQNLAPKVKGKCLKSYLISIGDYNGGTIGWDIRYNIYGLFNLQNNEKFILPLKNFLKKNNALNFIDKFK